MDNIVSKVEGFSKTKPHSNLKHNLRKFEEKTIKILTNHGAIIINEAYKGGAIVKMNNKSGATVKNNKDHYKDMLENIIDNVEYYEKLSTDSHKTVLQNK